LEVWMKLLQDSEIIGRLMLVAISGFLIGIEREMGGHSDGERIHAPAAVGAATFAVISLRASLGSDPARVAAGVVTGLGFLGAGTILKTGYKETHGLTTAAGISAVGANSVATGTEGLSGGHRLRHPSLRYPGKGAVVPDTRTYQPSSGPIGTLGTGDRRRARWERT
jgi:uncharacterized membrane protein YhiD involved in acid resistance